MNFLDRLSSRFRSAPATAPTPTQTPAPTPQGEISPPPADNDQLADSYFVWRLLASKSGSHLYFLNPDHVQVGLLDLIVDAPRLVLDVGCYCGATGETIKRRWPSATVIGIEPLAEAAQLAVPRIDRVITGTLESVDFEQAGIAAGSIDTIILADVLEHIYNPWLALQRLRPLLTDGGVVLASIPNVRNLGLIHKLVQGRWTYEGGGLLDITHIRFFTLAEVRAMFAQTGFDVRAVEHNVDPALAQLWNVQPGQEAANIQLGSLVIGQLSPADMKELGTLQFYIRAAKSN